MHNLTPQQRRHRKSVLDGLYATPKQEACIHALRRECEAKNLKPLWPPYTNQRQLRESASREIEMLKSILDSI